MYYRLDDTKTRGDLMYPIKVKDAMRWNDDKWGIFAPVNSFAGSLQIKDLTKVLAWYVDLDFLPPTLEKLLDDSPINPSMVNRTARGYHIYFNAIDGGTDNYWEIQERLFTFYGGDRIKNVNRVLRVPGFNHWKDPKRPFLIHTLHYAKYAYTEAEMLGAFPKKIILPIRRRRHKANDPFWELVRKVDCKGALITLSGSEVVNGEEYTFKRNHGTTEQIGINGDFDGGWLDEEGRIGSYEGRGPTIVQWLRWHEHSWKDIAEIAKTHLGVTDE